MIPPSTTPPPGNIGALSGQRTDTAAVVSIEQRPLVQAVIPGGAMPAPHDSGERRFKLQVNAVSIDAPIPATHSGDPALQPLLDHLMLHANVVCGTTPVRPHSQRPGWQHVSYHCPPMPTQADAGPPATLRDYRVLVTVDIDDTGTVRRCTWRDDVGAEPQYVDYPAPVLGHASQSSATLLPGTGSQVLGRLGEEFHVEAGDIDYVVSWALLPDALRHRVGQDLRGALDSQGRGLPVEERRSQRSGNVHRVAEWRDPEAGTVFVYFRLRGPQQPLQITQVAVRQPGGREWTTLPERERDDDAAVSLPPSVLSMSSVGSLGISGMGLGSPSSSVHARDEESLDAPQAQRRRLLAPLQAVMPASVGVVVGTTTPYQEFDDDLSHEALHVLHHVLQACVQPRGHCTLSSDPTQAMNELGKWLSRETSTGWGGCNVGAAHDPLGIKRTHALQVANRVGVLVAQGADGRYAVFQRRHQLDADRSDVQDWRRLDTTARQPPLAFHSLNEALAAMEVSNARLSPQQGLRVLYPKAPLPTVRNGAGQYLPGQGFKSVLDASAEEAAGAQDTPAGEDAAGAPLPLQGPQAHDPATLGAQLVPNPHGVYLQQQPPGGGCPACVINHILQATVLPIAALRTATLPQTARTLQQITGTPFSTHAVPPRDAAALAQLTAALAMVGVGMFEVGDLTLVGGGAHQVTLFHRSGRATGDPHGLWLVLDSGRPGANEPASATPFTGANGLNQALVHLAGLSHGMLSACVPTAALPATQDGHGAFVPFEGWVAQPEFTDTERQALTPIDGQPPRLHPAPATWLGLAPPSDLGATAQSSNMTAVESSGVTPSQVFAGVLATILHRLDSDYSASLFTFVESLANCRTLDADALAAIPDLQLRRMVYLMTGVRPEETDPLLLRQQLQPFTQPGALPDGLLPWQFINAPGHFQNVLLVNQAHTRVRSAAMSMWQIQPRSFQVPTGDTYRPNLEENRLLVAQEQSRLSPAAQSMFRRWMRWTEEQRLPGQGSLVTQVLSQLATDVVGYETRRGISIQGRDLSNLLTARPGVAEFLEVGPATRGLFLSIIRQVAPLCGTVTPSPRLSLDHRVLALLNDPVQQQTLAPLADALAERAMDGCYSPLNLLLHQHPTFDAFLEAVQHELALPSAVQQPTHVVVDAPMQEALRALHRTFRERHYSATGVPRSSAPS